jgi:hypothetical protein
MKSRTQAEFVKRWEELLQGKLMRGYVSRPTDAAEVLKMMAADALRLRELLEYIWQREIEPPQSDMILRLTLAAMPKNLGNGATTPKQEVKK